MNASDAPTFAGAAPPRWLLPTLCLGVGGLGLWLLRDARALPAMTWMWIYQPSDIGSVADAIRFLADLRVPIPPYLAALEIGSTWLTGGPDLVTRGLYRFCLVASYAAAMLLVSGSTPRLLLTAATSVLFLASTAIVHPGNPAVYDAVFPLLVLGFLWVGARVGRHRTRFRLLVPGAAGLLLSLLELTRPYVLYLLPFLLLYVVPRLGGAGRGPWLAFLAPLVLLSGLWHGNQLWAHGQLTWSNHVGFNMHYAWPMVEKPPLQPEPNAPLRPGRWKNLDTPEHGRNSAQIRNAVLAWMVANPGYALTHAAGRLTSVLMVHTQIYRHDPKDRILTFYRLVGMLGACLAIITVLRLGFRILASPRESLGLFLVAEHQAAGVAAGCLLIVALGEHGEEARFVISVLPLLALWPLPQTSEATASSQPSVASRSTGNDL